MEEGKCGTKGEESAFDRVEKVLIIERVLFLKGWMESPIEESFL